MLKRYFILFLFLFTFVALTTSVYAKLCYQESPDVSTECGGVNTGSYSIKPYYIYINYTKPPGAVRDDAKYQIRHTKAVSGLAARATTNRTIPADCWNASDVIQIRIYSNLTITPDNGISEVKCYNGAGWTNIWSSTYGGYGVLSKTLTMSPEDYAFDGNWATSVAYSHDDASWVYKTTDTDSGNWGAYFFEDAMYWNMAAYRTPLVWISGDDDYTNDTFAYDQFGTQNGTIVGTNVNVSNGILGNGFETNANGEYIDMTSTSVFQRTDDFSYTIWINKTLNDTDLYMALGSANYASLATDWGWEMRFQSNNVTWFATDGTNQNKYSVAYDGTHLEDGQFHHYVFAYDSSANSYKIYIDGELNGTVTGMGTIDYTTWYKFTLGNRPRTDSISRTYVYDLDGQLDEFGFYDELLTAMDVKALYNNGVATNPTNIITVTDVDISPSLPLTNDTLVATCNATTVDGDSLSYTYEWHIFPESVNDKKAAYYNFNTNLYDKWNGYDGTMSTPDWVDDHNEIDGQAMAFNGSAGQYFETDYEINLSNPLTMSFWLRRTESWSTAWYMSESFSLTTDGGVRLEQRYDNDLRFRYSSSGDTITVEPVPMTWTHIVWVHGGTDDDGNVTFSVYQDGSLVDTHTYGGAKTKVVNFTLGRPYIDYGGYEIDDVMLFEKALTSSEVGKLYNTNTANTTSASDTDEGDEVYVSCSAGDGFDGVYLESAPVTILNTPPYLDNVSIENPITSSDDIYGAADVFDYDNDSLFFDSDWYVNDVLVSNDDKSYYKNLGTDNAYYYPFNGNITDLWNAQNATINGAVLTADRFGNANSAYYFDGVDDTFSVSGDINLSNPFTYFFWFRIDRHLETNETGTAFIHNIYDNGNIRGAFRESVCNGDGIRWRWNDTGGGSYCQMYDVGVWEMAAVVKGTDNNIRIYEDGELKFTYSDLNQVYGNKTVFNIYQNVEGAVDDIIILDYALSPTQVEALYKDTTSDSTKYDKDDTVILQVGVYDGTDFVYKNSSSVTILNTPPILVNASMTPQGPLTGTDITGVCNATDYDNDTLIYDYTWFVNDAQVSINTCYQESAAVEDQTGIDGICGLNYSGSYVFSGWFDGSNTYDGDWSTWGYGGIGNLMYINYSKPNSAISAVWTAKLEEHPSGASTTYVNVTIPDRCFDVYSDKLELRVRSDGAGTNNFRFFCYNSTTWENIAEYAVARLYEEAIIWTVSNQTLFSDYTAFHDDIILQCEASDGTNVTYLNSSFEQVLSSPPVVNSVSIISGTNQSNEPLIGQCNASDVDGQSLQFYYEWFKNNVSVLSGNTEFWTDNASLTFNITGPGTYTNPAVYWHNDTLTLIMGSGNGLFFGHQWNGSQWVANSSVVTGLPDVGSYASPSVVYYEGKYILMTGASDSWRAFQWDDTLLTWFENTTLKSGTGSNIRAVPELFVYQDTLYMASGKLDGKFLFSIWNGTMWSRVYLSDFDFEANLIGVDVGTYSTTHIFEYGDYFILFVGSLGGKHRGYYFNGTEWERNDELLTYSLGNPGSNGDVGAYSNVDTFMLDGKLRAMVGEQASGDYNAFDYQYFNPDELHTINVLGPGNMTKDDVWRFSCAVTDVASTSTWMNSTDITILNSPPILLEANITPQTPLSNESLTGFCNATDSDADNLSYGYVWYINGTDSGAPNQDTLQDSYTEKGDVVILQCSASDASETECEQETATSTTPCGGLDTGAYGESVVWGGGFVTLANLSDGDYDTYSIAASAGGYDACPDNDTKTHGEAYFYVNYTIPAGVESDDVVWSVKHGLNGGGVATDNLTLPLECVNDTAVQLRLRSYDSELCPGQYSTGQCRERSEAYCYNGAGWTNMYYFRGTGLTNCNANRIYEEKIIWTTSVAGSESYLNSSPVTVQNTPPVVENLTIIPTNPMSNDTLEMQCDATDYDNDTLTYNYTWFVNGALTPTCYQESVNETNQTGIDGVCDLDYSGEYNFADTYINPENIIDGDYDTFGYSTLTSAYIYINYTKPDDVYGAYWVVDHRQDFLRVVKIQVIPDSCMNASPDMLMLRLRSGTTLTSRLYLYCYDNTSWVTMWSSGRNDIFVYDEAVKWFVSTDTLSDMFVDKDDNVTGNCIVTDGTYKSNNITTAETLILNTPPVVDFVSIIGAYPEQTLNGSCNVSDYDEDTTTKEYNWYVNTVAVGQTGLNLSNTYIDIGDNVTFSCRVNDSTNYSVWTNSSITQIINHGVINFTNLVDDSDAMTEIGSTVHFEGDIELYDTVDTCTLYIKPTTSPTPFDNDTMTVVGTTSVTANYTFVISTAYTAAYDNITWYITCNDTSGNYETSSLIGLGIGDIGDYTDPEVEINTSISTILVNGTVVDSVLNGIININTTFRDANLFQASVNITCEASGQVFYWENLNLNVTEYNYSSVVDLTGLPPQRCNVTLSSSDDHTAEKIPNYKYTMVSDTLEYETENGLTVSITSSDLTENIKTTKITDRYNFEFSYPDSKLIRKYVIESDGELYTRQDTVYPGHFVAWNPKTHKGNWIDFALPNSEDFVYVVNKINANKYEIIIAHKVLVTPELKDQFEKNKGASLLDAILAFFTTEKPIDEEHLKTEDIEVKFLETERELSASEIESVVDIQVDSASDLEDLETDYGIEEVKFNSIGGTNVVEVQTYFYIGGIFNITSNNQYTSLPFSGYTARIQKTNAPTSDNSYTFNTSQNYIENVIAGNYLLTLSHPEFVTQTFTETMTTLYDECEQEQANISTACGGLATGVYGFSDITDLQNVSNMFDNDTLTYATVLSFNDTYIYMNYTIPNNVTFAAWTVTAFGVSIGVEIPLDTFNKTILQTRIVARNGAGNNYITLQEYNGTVWEDLTYTPLQVYNSQIFEEKMTWYTQVDNTIPIHYNTSQAIITFVHKNIKTSNNVNNYSLIVSGDNITVQYNITDGSAGLTLPLNANVTYNVTFVKAGYDNQSFTYVFDYREEATYTEFLTYNALINFLDEASLEPFDFDDPLSAYLLVKCEGQTYSYELSNQTLIANTSSYEFDVLCNYTNFRFILTYAGGTSYYRTLIVDYEDSLNGTFYLIDLSTTAFVYGSFIIDDLFGSYENPSIYIKKAIGEEVVDIQSDFTDIENKVGYYLIENNEYIVEVHSDNNPIQVIGTYSADVGGEKVISMYDISLDSDAIGYSNNVQYTVEMINNSGQKQVLFNYYDIENDTESIQYRVYVDRLNGTLIYESPVYTNVNELGNFYVPVLGYENRTLVGTMEIVHSEVGSQIITKMVNKEWGILLPLQEHVSQQFLNWFFLLVLSVVAIYAAINTNIAALVITGLAVLFVLFGWFTMSVSVLAIAILLALFDFLVRRRGGK